MTIIMQKRPKISAATQRKLQERSGVLYSRALERWNRRPTA
ncbi:MAG: hypothetical protein ABI282_08295 [Candidatus Baltobacteraceae bacterium]